VNALERLVNAYERPSPPPVAEFSELADDARSALLSEAPERRPLDSRGLPGGLLYLRPELPTIVIPDLHARTGFILSVMETRLPGGQSVYDALAEGRIQILCLGDGFHAEGRARARWKAAFEEFLGGYARHEAMDQEMTESLALMEMVMIAKTAFPGHFHFLKGNHENVKNEEGGGNHPFKKFQLEGDMVLAWLRAFAGEDLIERHAAFEAALPVFAVGARVLASHAEPRRAFSAEELVEARSRPEVVEGLTWTDNDAAEPGAVAELLARLLPGVRRPRLLTGHRVIPGLYRERSGGLHLQIHNPDRYVVAWAMPDRDLEPELDIGEMRSAPWRNCQRT